MLRCCAEQDTCSLATGSSKHCSAVRLSYGTSHVMVCVRARLELHQGGGCTVQACWRAGWCSLLAVVPCCCCSYCCRSALAGRWVWLPDARALGREHVPALAPPPLLPTPRAAAGRCWRAGSDWGARRRDSHAPPASGSEGVGGEGRVGAGSTSPHRVREPLPACGQRMRAHACQCRAWERGTQDAQSARTAQDERGRAALGAHSGRARGGPGKMCCWSPCRCGLAFHHAARQQGAAAAHRLKRGGRGAHASGTSRAAVAGGGGAGAVDAPPSCPACSPAPGLTSTAPERTPSQPNPARARSLDQFFACAGKRPPRCVRRRASRRPRTRGRSGGFGSARSRAG